MCNCIDEIEENIEKHYAQKGKEVVEIDLKSVGDFYKLDGLDGKTRKTKTDVKIRFAKGKPESTYLKHDFCPFCGKSYHAENKPKEEEE